MFRIAVFSDIHGNLEALESILSSIEKEEFDEIVCLGDIIGIGPNPKECLDLIINKNIKMVLGNHERYYLYGADKEKMSEGEIKHHDWVRSVLGFSYRDFLSKQNLDLTITVNENKIGFMHYPFDKVGDDFYAPKELTEDNVKLLFRNYNNQFTFFGHSHNEELYKDNNEFVYINVGSAGCTRDDVTNYTILEFDGEDYSIYKRKCIYDRRKFEEVLEEVNYPEKEYLMNRFF